MNVISAKTLITYFATGKHLWKKFAKLKLSLQSNTAMGAVSDGNGGKPTVVDKYGHSLRSALV